MDLIQQNAGINRVYSSMRGELPPTGLLIREGFSYRALAAGTLASDRKALPRELRPPATRLMSSRGSALRFILTLIALVQTRRRAGAKAKLVEFGFEVAGHTSAWGWTDLIASDATNSNSGGVFLTARDKRARIVRNALLSLEEAGLVDIPGRPGERNRFEKFVLLNERGVEAIGEHEEYRVPTKAEPTFTFPAGLIANGWLHVLEDSEIAILLMVACAREGWRDGGLLVMPPEIRLQNYGIHRDIFSSARKTLVWFGLLNVEELGRHGDGRAENGDQLVHRLGLVPEGFESPAATVVMSALTAQLARR
ncbi:MAG: hypothetical protein RIC81_00790 [Microcella pacifica]|uniref:Uncharacterized protein n=1 Tax=Microcella pacifica TaxID=2591847 RepID=A0A9E5JR35_9MICO|nr:hypothetical protein [Microcella pacifica]NHF63307.1 hypothetical protein [Microcella pacifica]